MQAIIYVSFNLFIKGMVFTILEKVIKKCVTKKQWDVSLAQHGMCSDPYKDLKGVRIEIQNNSL